MKNTNFNRKRIAICISFLFIIILSVFSVEAFSFRKQNRTVSQYSDKPSEEAANNICNILQYQLQINPMGRGSYLQVIFIVQSSSNYEIHAIISAIEDGTSSVSISQDTVTYNFGNSSEYFYNDQAGFYEARTTQKAQLVVDSKFIIYSDYNVPTTSIPSFNGFNENASFGSSNFNSSDVLSYFKHINDAALYLDEYVSEAFSEGLATGQGEGYQIGLEQGYNQGYDSGFEDGEDRGYIEGQTEGYSEGYSEGFDFGVENGYRLGFDEGKEEGYSEGYSEGESNGYSSGHQVGFDEGREEGYTLGFDNGYSEGYTEGYSEGYETGYNIVYDDLQQPGTIEAIFTTKDSSGNTLYLAQEADIANLTINYAFLPKDQLSDSYIGYRLYVKTYDVTKYLQDNPLDFDYPLPVIEYQNTDFLALYRKVNVTREYFDLYRVYSYVEVKIDQSFINQLNNQYNEGLNDANALVNGIGDIATKPITSLKDALNFEIFGLNIGIVAVGIIAILFAIWAYNKIRKVLPI